mmetsp:Transcript_16535/g.32866  ORF Transcript_16535/g.32866 Transcript_16535/m.32866 type:complete len:202 (+) Transcript_16535:117-722(+)
MLFLRLLALVALCGLSSAAKEEPFQVKFDVVLAPGSYGSFIIECYPEWAPLGVAQFREIIETKIWTGARFFRVIPGFMVQWGIPGKTSDAAEWEGRKIKDDSVVESNKRGLISFATSGKDTRTTQVFINFADNANLDGMGFSPFGRVIEGMDVVDKIYSGDREKPEQGKITAEGNKYLKKKHPRLSYIKSADFLGAAAQEL